MPKKILISTNDPWNVFNFRLNLIKELCKDYKIIIIVNKKNKYSLKLEEFGFDLIYLNFNNRGKGILENIILFINYFFIFKRIRPEYFLPFTIKPNIFGSIVARFFGIKTINNITGLGNVFIEGGLLKKVIILLYKFALNKTLITFFQNTHDQKLFQEYKIINKKKSIVIPGSGIDLGKYNYNKLKNNSEHFNFIYFGRLITDKGILILLDVINMCKYNNKIKFTIIGSMDQSDKNFKKISEIIYNNKNHNLNYISFTDDIKNEILKADCVILPSYREGLPRSLIEASALGIPIIASNVPGCNNLIKDQYNGLLFNPLSSNSLHNKLIEFTKLSYIKRVKLTENARDHVEKYFDEKLVINKYKEYIDVINYE